MIRICLGSVVLLVALCSYATPNTIRVLAIEYPPFTSSSIEGNGLCFDYLDKYFSENSIHLSIDAHFVPPARAEAFILSGEHCISFYPPRQRPELFSFVPLVDDKVKLGLIRLAREERFSWNSLDELAGNSVAILRANTESDNVQNMRAAGMHIIWVESVLQGLKMVREQRADYVFGDLDALKYLSNDLGSDRDAFQVSETSLMEAVIGFHYRVSCKDKIFGTSQ